MERASFGPDGQFVFDATSIDLASACLRKYYYSMIRNIEPKNKSVHLIFGGIYASAIELYHKERALGASHDSALVGAVHHALSASWGVAFDHPAKTRDNLVRSIIWYLDERNKNDFETYIRPDGSAAVELSFSLMANEEFMYAGHLDRVVLINGDFFWLDNKTTSGSLGQRFFEGFKPSNQFYGYTWAGQTILGRPVRGGVIDAAQIQVGTTRFERQIINATPDQLSEWLDNTIAIMYGVQAAYKANKWPMNLTACGNYGGCPFRELCSAPPSVRERFIEGNFKEREQPWDPATPR